MYVTFLKEPLTSLSQRAWSYWRAKNVFEKWMFTCLVGVFAIWIVVFEMLLPAMDVWRRAPRVQANLDAQWDQVQHLQKKAQELRGSAATGPAFPVNQVRELAESLLGATSRVEVVEDEIHLEFEGVSPQNLGALLNQIYALRSVNVVHAQWSRGQIRPEATQATHAVWDGFLILKAM